MGLVKKIAFMGASALEKSQSFLRYHTSGQFHFLSFLGYCIFLLKTSGQWMLASGGRRGNSAFISCLKTQTEGKY